jgi:hypothetical protein
MHADEEIKYLSAFIGVYLRQNLNFRSFSLRLRAFA